jgi:hypothetical protein
MKVVLKDWKKTVQVVIECIIMCLVVVFYSYIVYVVIQVVRGKI